MNEDTQQRLPRSPCKTGVSGGSARQPSVYKGSRPAYPQAQYLRASQICLSASPLFTGAPSQPIRKCPIDKGSRSNQSETPKRRGIQADESLRSAAAGQSDQSGQPRITAGTRRSGSATASPQNKQCFLSFLIAAATNQRSTTWPRKKQRQSSRELKNKPCFATGFVLPQPAARASPARRRPQEQSAKTICSAR